MVIEFVSLKITISYFNLKHNKKCGYFKNLFKVEIMRKQGNLKLTKYRVVVVDGFRWNIKNRPRFYCVKMEIVSICLEFKMIIH